MSDSTEFIVDGSVAQANPSHVRSEIWYWNATQMRANGRANQDLRVTSVRQSGNGLFIQLGGERKSVGIFDFSKSKSSNEDNLTVPGGLEDLTRWEFRDIKFFIGISDVSSVSDHLTVDNGDDGLDTNDVSGEDETLHHVHLGSLDFVVSVLLVPESVLIEPVVNFSLGVKWVSEVGWS